jgi:glycosyltransferase involved in cell wall biosynthesis
MGLRIVDHQPDDFRARVVVPLPLRPGSPNPDRWRPAVDVVVPVHNREAELEPRIRRLHSFLVAEFPFSSRITIADDASTDGTRAAAERLAAELSGVHVLRINPKGRGRALAAAWLTSEARVVAYMDLDRAADPSVLPALVAPIISGHSDVSVSGPAAQSHQHSPSPLRERVGERVINLPLLPSRERVGERVTKLPLLLGLALRARFPEPHRGFKAMRADTARRLIPDVAGRGWFFDTELLARAERAGLRIHFA